MERADLGFLLGRLMREVAAGEEPIFAEVGLSMWDYVILVGLDGAEAPTQAHLAERTGRDKTRLIRHLETLEGLGYVRRVPDPADRRNRVVSLTTSGRKVLRRCRTGITLMESRLLAPLEPEERTAFLEALVRLVGPHAL